MSLNYGYLCSTKEVAKDFSKYNNFMEDKKAFESVPNVNISRSIDTNSQPIDPQQMVFSHNHKLQSKYEAKPAQAQHNTGKKRV